jgi:hypothetical protein
MRYQLHVAKIELRPLATYVAIDQVNSIFNAYYYSKRKNNDKIISKI